MCDRLSSCKQNWCPPIPNEAKKIRVAQDPSIKLVVLMNDKTKRINQDNGSTPP